MSKAIDELFSLCVMKTALEFFSEHYEPSEEWETALMIGAEEILSTVKNLVQNFPKELS